MAHTRAIETLYGGYHFRSRLEARWAVFFDTLGIAYEYEPQGFDLGAAGSYLPDFWLPEQGCWVEIKGQTPTAWELTKAQALAAQSGVDVFVFAGPIPFPVNPTSADLIESAYRLRGDGKPIEPDDQMWAWEECVSCGALRIVFPGYPERFSCRYPTCRFDWAACGTPRLMEAYLAARTARFEYGETPAPRKLRPIRPVFRTPRKQARFVRVRPTRRVTAVSQVNMTSQTDNQAIG